MTGIPRIPRPAVRIFGALMLLASLGFLVDAAIRADLGGVIATVDAEGGTMLALLGIGYGLALILLAIAWWLIMLGDERARDFGSAFAVYGLSVFAKYLPGSVFQYASRQALGARFGWPQAAVAKASVAEIALHLATSLGVFLAADRLLGLRRVGDLPAAIIGGATLIALAWLFLRAPGMRWRLLLAIGAQLLFFAAMLLIATGCAIALGVESRPALAAGALFLLAWLAGFVAPGVPGGIGVREAGIVVTASTVLGPGSALLFAAATRLVTLGGDALFALAALFVGRRRAREQAGAGKV